MVGEWMRPIKEEVPGQVEDETMVDERGKRKDRELKMECRRRRSEEICLKRKILKMRERHLESKYEGTFFPD